MPSVLFSSVVDRKLVKDCLDLHNMSSKATSTNQTADVSQFLSVSDLKLSQRAASLSCAVRPLITDILYCLYVGVRSRGLKSQIESKRSG